MFYLKQTFFLLLEFLLFLILLAVFGAILYGILIYAVDFSHGFTEKELISEHPYIMLVEYYLPVNFITLAAIWLIHSLIFKRDESTLGFNKKGLLDEYAYGFVLAFILIGVGFVLLLILNQIDIVGSNFNGVLLLGFLLLFTFQSFSEEIIFRAYLIPTIENRLGTWAALILSSLGFMAMHLFNDNISIIGVIDLFVGGILMGLLFIKFRNIWAPTGFHVAWNYFQSAVFGFEVSGYETYSWVVQDEIGNDILTGGKFGFEASILSVIFSLAVIGWMWKSDKSLAAKFVKARRKKIPEEGIV